jgi:glycine/betaine/sarcosine/D-proline reductase family selenoprotein B
MKKAIYYLNQFFGQIGGEEKADYMPEIREGVLGPGMLLKNWLEPDIEVTHTIICGDNFFGSKKEEAIEMILGFLEDKSFDVFIAGPAFMAGRYGFACGEMCKAVKEKFNVPVITSMNVENPAVEMFRKDIYIFSGGNSAAAMRKDVPTMAEYTKRLLAGEEMLSAKEEGYFSMGIRAETFAKPPKIGADRVVEMLLQKLNGEEYETEIPIPKIDKVPIVPAVEDLSKATVALVTSGGIVPKGNPDGIQSASATKWGKYDMTGQNALKAGEWETIHAGFDPTAANENPNVIAPLDAMSHFENERKFGRLYHYLYSTVGTGTTQAEASRMGNEIAQELLEANVSAVVLTST